MMDRKTFKKFKEENGYKIQETGNNLVIPSTDGKIETIYHFDKKGLYYGCTIKNKIPVDRQKIIRYYKYTKRGKQYDGLDDCAQHGTHYHDGTACNARLGMGNNYRKDFQER